MANGLDMDGGLANLVSSALTDPTAPTLDMRAARPSYVDGGMVAPGGAPQVGVAPQGQQQAPIPLQNMQQEIQRMQQQNPQEVAKVTNAIMQALQSGDLTMEELNTIVQLATAAAQNPEFWPQIRAYAIQNGLAEEAELSPEYDQGLVFAILLAAQSIQQGAGAPPMADGQPPIASMEGGGALPEASRNADGSIPINAHEGEYVIPGHIVRAKGTEFFDKMLEGYNDDQAQGS